jgi:spermidine synthase/MFS family permease
MHGASGLPKNLVSSFLFLSGATALVYELVWSKYLANVLGNSGQAHAVVLATFMGGLALGAYVFGRTADRVKSPLAMYGLLELGVGLYALLFPSVLEVLSAAYLAVAMKLPEGARVVPRLALAALSLLVPTMLMGGTLPALVRHFSSSLAHVRRELARLYAINSLGAALGVFLAGVSLVPALGLSLSAKLAASLNILLALGALVLARRAPPALASAEGGAAAEGGDELSYPHAAVRAALLGVLLSGFTSMLYQVTWIRLLSIVLGASTYAFTLILTAFILGIGLGSFWLMTRKGREDLLRLFAWLQVGLVVSVCVALPLYVRLPYLFRKAQLLMNRTLDAWPYYQLLTFAFCCLVLLVPTFFMGAAFPAAARVATAKVAQLGRQLGGVYLWNTVGTITGAALGGLVLMPWWGMEGNFIAGLVGNLLAAGVAFAAVPGRPTQPVRAFWPLGLGAACGVLFLLPMSGWAVTLSGIASFRVRDTPPESYAAAVARFEQGSTPIFYRDDTFATVLVGELKHDQHRYMKLNGKVDASTGLDMETQIIAGHLGMLLHPREPRNVLLVGAGSGVTAGSVLAHPVEHLDMVEISPAVVDAARLFKAVNRNALEDPRTHVHIDDAKTFMALAPRKYDLVISEPSNPWVAGVSGLFSRDFFRTVDRHLTEDGVLVQWIHTYESSEEILKLVVRTLRETFPHATTWLGPTDLILVASRKPLTLDAQRVAERLARPAVREDLGRTDIHDLFGLLAKQVHSEQGQLEFAGAGPINTDDHNQLEYAAPVAFFLHNLETRVQDERRSPHGSARLWLHRYMEEHPPTAEQAARLYRNLDRNHALNDPLMRGAASLWYSLAPDSLEARVALANTALAQKDLTLAESVLAPVLARGRREPRFVSVWLRLAAARAWGTRTAWTPAVGLPEAVALGRQLVAEHPEDTELARSLKAVCEALPRACLESPAVAAPGAP